MHLVTEARFLAYEHKDVLKKNSTFRGIGKGKRAFLLATGPSIKREDLRLLAGEDCFGISNFYLHEHLQIVNPVFHGFAPYHEPMILDNYVEWLRQADQVLPPQTKIVLGHKTYDMVQKFGLFPKRDVCYLYLAPSKMCCVDIQRPVLAPMTGPLLMLPLMIYMGYERIYLLGCDNTTLRDYKKTVSNFYNSDQDMRKAATDRNCWFDIETEFRANLTCFEQYRYYKNLLLNTSTSITNLSVDSWLEMFPMDRLLHIMKSHS